MAKRPERPLELASRLALRPADAAEALGISERKFREILPELPYVYIGSAIVVPVDGLLAWLAKETKRDDSALEDRIRNVLDEYL